jgi:hypothetical protein
MDGSASTVSGRTGLDTAGSQAVAQHVSHLLRSPRAADVDVVEFQLGRLRSRSVFLAVRTAVSIAVRQGVEAGEIVHDDACDLNVPYEGDCFDRPPH